MCPPLSDNRVCPGHGHHENRMRCHYTRWIAQVDGLSLRAGTTLSVRDGPPRVNYSLCSANVQNCVPGGPLKHPTS